MPCYKPIEVPKKGFVDLRVQVACGRCIGCRLDKKLGWALRLMDEAQLHQDVLFTTMTYDDAHLPRGGTLVKRHVQLFHKRLSESKRQEFKKFQALLPVELRTPWKGVRYLTGGEYGETTWRPHYHSILFGAKFADMRPHSKSGDHQLYASEEFDALWGMGHCLLGYVSLDTCAYVAGYVTKKIAGQMAEEHYRRVDPYTGEVFDLLPEFALMSRRPGIGSGWYEKFKDDVFPSDTKVVKGKPGSVPPFYVERLKNEDVAAYEAVKARRMDRLRARRADNTPARLKVREEVAIARLGMKLRDKI